MNGPAGASLGQVSLGSNPERQVPALEMRCASLHGGVVTVAEAYARIANAVNRLHTSPQPVSNEANKPNEPQPTTVDRRLELTQRDLDEIGARLHQLADRLETIV